MCAGAIMLLLAGLTGGCGPGAPPAVTPQQTAPQQATPQQATPLWAARQVEIHLTCATGDDEAPCAFRPDEVSIAAGGVVQLWIKTSAGCRSPPTDQSRSAARAPRSELASSAASSWPTVMPA